MESSIPSYVIRGEEVIASIVVSNYLEKSAQVSIMDQRGTVSMYNHLTFSVSPPGSPKNVTMFKYFATLGTLKQ